MVNFKMVLIVIAGIAAISCSEKETPSPETTAAHSLQDFRQLVDSDNYWKFGFKSYDELSEMTLGDSIPVYFVGLEELRALQAGESPARLLDEIHELIYPVMVKGEHRSSISLKQRAGEWRVWNFGRPGLATAIARVRDEHAEASGRPVKQYFAIEIPAMYLVFVGHFDDDALMLTHVHQHGTFQLQPGKTESGADLIARIAAGSKEYTPPLSAR